MQLFPDFFKGQPVDLNPEMVALEKEGFARLVENDAERSLILGGEVAGRIDDLPTVAELMNRMVAEPAAVLPPLPSFLNAGA